jgi:hypothetical protein
LDSVEIIEELERLQGEFGPGKVQIPDPLEAQWWYEVDRVEFDSVTQTYRMVSDH